MNEVFAHAALIKHKHLAMVVVIDQAMAIGIGFDDGHDLAVRTGERPAQRRIVTQGFEVDLGPATGWKGLGSRRRHHLRTSSSFWIVAKSPSSQQRTKPSQNDFNLSQTRRISSDSSCEIWLSCAARETASRSPANCCTI